MPSSTTELIKSKLDVVEFIRGYVTLTAAGKNFKGLCPFHKEKSPSFMVSPDRQSWHCFGCGLGGDIFTFAMRYENIEFTEALRMLAEKAGVELRRENPAEYKFSGLLYDLNTAAKDYFRRAYEAAPVAKKYLADRGLKPDIIEEFEVGWAPNEPEGLSMFFLNSGTSPQDLLQAGLAFKTERGLMLDRFRGRIMFPIHNHLGKVVGFTGRILPQLDRGDMGKYVNSPETPIFQKSKLLYGFWKSKDAIREAKSAFLVEGQMDFLMSYQADVKNVIASSGTALTADHLRAVHRLAEELVVSFDNDAAGAEAAERAIDLAEAQDFSVKVALFSSLGKDKNGNEIKDAADAVNADPANIAKVIASAVPAPEFYFQKYLPGELMKNPAALSTREGLTRLRAVLAKLRAIASPVERDFWVKELSKRTGIKEKTLEDETEKSATTHFVSNAGVSTGGNSGGGFGGGAGSGGGDGMGGTGDSQEITKRKATRHELLAEELFAAVLADGNFAIVDECAEFFNPTQKEIARILKSGKKESEDPALDGLIDLIVLRPVGEVTGATLSNLKEQLAKEYYKERRQILSLAIRNAEARGDDAELKAAMEELDKLPTTRE